MKLRVPGCSGGIVGGHHTTALRVDDDILIDAGTGDTTSNDALWACLNRLSNLRHLLIETAFRDDEKAIAIASKHFHSSMLAEGLKNLKQPPEIYLTHLKPGDEAAIVGEIPDLLAGCRPTMLKHNATLEF
jgi:hypothetical protein